MSKRYKQEMIEKGVRVSLNLIVLELDFYHQLFLELPNEMQSHVALCLMPSLSSFLVESSAFMNDPKTRLHVQEDSVDWRFVKQARDLLEAHQSLLLVARQRMKFFGRSPEGL